MLANKVPSTIVGNCSFVRLSRHKAAIVDTNLLPDLKKYSWSAVKSAGCWYALRRYRKDGKMITVRMHRHIAQTQTGMVCHHINGNSLDNRQCNLLNMTEYWHIKLYSWR